METQEVIQKLVDELYEAWINKTPDITIEDVAIANIQGILLSIEQRSDEGCAYAVSVVNIANSGWKKFCDKAGIDEKELFKKLLYEKAPEVMKLLDDYKEGIQGFKDVLALFGIPLYEEEP